MNISELITTLEKCKNHIGDVEIFINNNVLCPNDINSGRADVLLPVDLVESEDFGKLFSSDDDLLVLG